MTFGPRPLQIYKVVSLFTSADSSIAPWKSRSKREAWIRGWRSSIPVWCLKSSRPVQRCTRRTDALLRPRDLRHHKKILASVYEHFLSLLNHRVKFMCKSRTAPSQSLLHQRQKSCGFSSRGKRPLIERFWFEGVRLVDCSGGRVGTCSAALTVTIKAV